MIQLTPEATTHLLQVRKTRGLDDRLGVRFVSRAGRVGVTFAKAPEAGDRILEVPGIVVSVAPDVVQVLDERIIDARAGDGKTGLVIRNRARRVRNDGA